MTEATSVTVVVPLNIRRRGGRKAIVGPDGATVRAGGSEARVAETRGDPALVKALARAFRWRRMLEDRHHGSARELAKSESVSRVYVGRLLNLTLLAPDIVEAILDGRQPEQITVRALMAPLPAAWADQRQASATCRAAGASREEETHHRP